MTNVIDLEQKRMRDYANKLVMIEADTYARALMSMSRAAWAERMSGPEALRAAARSIQVAAGKMNAQ